MNKDISFSTTSVREQPTKRSASVGAVPREKKHYTSRAESSAGVSLDVRCACQFFQSDSLLPERVNPIGSRPESNIGFVAEIPLPLDLSQADLQSGKQFDQISTRSCALPGRHPESDRISAKSFGGQRSCDSHFNSTKRKELEEYARRGLVVRSISDANDPLQPFSPVLSRGQREISTDRQSNRSFDMHDPDTISNRSFGLRRISRPQSKQDLFVADIIIPTKMPIHSRRNSNIELPQFNRISATPEISVNKLNFLIQKECNREQNKENLKSINKSILPDSIKAKPIECENITQVNTASKPPLLFEVPIMNIELETVITEKLSTPAPTKDAKLIINDSSTMPLQNRPIVIKKESAVLPVNQSGYGSSIISLPLQNQPLSVHRPHIDEITSEQKGSLNASSTQPVNQSGYISSPISMPLQNQPLSVHRPHLDETVAEGKVSLNSSPSQGVIRVNQSGYVSSPISLPLQNQPLSVHRPHLDEIASKEKVSLNESSNQPQLRVDQSGYISAPISLPLQNQPISVHRPHLNETASEVKVSLNTSSTQPGLRVNQSGHASSPISLPLQNQPISIHRPHVDSSERSVCLASSIQPGYTSPPISLPLQNQPISIHMSDADEISPDRNTSLKLSSQRVEKVVPPVLKNENVTASKLPLQNQPLNITKITQVSSASSVPTENYFLTVNSDSAALKRQHSPERDQAHSEAKHKVLESQELKKEKSSMFSFFGSKPKNNNCREVKKEKSPAREITPIRDRSPARLLGSRRRSKPELIVMTDETSVMTISGPQKASQSKTPSIMPPSTTIQETFSLKVDELDQYGPKPKPLPTTLPAVTSQKLKVSSINLNAEHISDYSGSEFFEDEHFRPIIVPGFIQNENSKSQISTSNPDLPSLNAKDKKLVEFETKSQKDKNLVSVNIGIPIDNEGRKINAAERGSEYSGSGFLADDHFRPIIISGSSQNVSSKNKQDDPNSADRISREISLKRTSSVKSAGRTPSEQRQRQSSLFRNKGYVDRTQSQDRANSSQDSWNEEKLTKTVSFDFGNDRSKSNMLDEKEQSSSGTNNKKDWLEKTYFSRDHEYEPIGQPQSNESNVPNLTLSQPMEVDSEIEVGLQLAEQSQKELEQHFITTAVKALAQAEIQLEDEIFENQAIDEIGDPPLKDETRKKGFMASAQDRSRKLQASMKNQAGKVKTKIRSLKKQNTVSGSPTKAKERRKFSTPEFSKIKMPEMPKFNKPDMSKFKAPEFKKIEFKRPDFTKFNKPDMSKFKIPEKFSSLKLRRSKSLKEEDVSVQTGESGTTPEASPAKKKFEFNFGTYPRALRRKKIKDSIEEIHKTHDTSTVPSSETQPSEETTVVKRGTRDKGPVGSRWTDKFSDVSYGDSESGKFRRYGSEVESFERESSIERRMKEDLAAQEESELALIGNVEHKQFAEFDEENRAIHEISKIREGEFRQRKPMVHQDSNMSEDSKDVGWSDKDIMRNKMLKRAELESEGYNYASEEGLTGSAYTNQETQSTGSSTAKKGVIEEIDDDEFFLRKRGISQDNIEIRQYISEAIREGFDMPVNALAQLGSSQGEYPDSMLGISQENIGYAYDIQPPTKPRRSKRRMKRELGSHEVSQEFDIEQKENYDDNVSLSQTGSDYFNKNIPNRPLRKSHKGYSEDSQSDIQNMPYFEDIEKDFYHKTINLEDPNLMAAYIDDSESFEVKDYKALLQPPKAPKRRKKISRESEERESYMNGFGGRSVSNSYLGDDNQPEQMIVYRTEHEYNIPLAQPDSFSTTPAPTIRRSRSRTNNEEDDRTSRGADSLPDGLIVEDENNEKFRIQINHNNGYATVKKEPPPRPPPPTRRRKRFGSRSPGERFSTMPHPIRATPPPERPKRNYSTIGPPRPPRRKTSFSSADTEKSALDVTEYEELDVEEEMIEPSGSPKNLQTGEIFHKMKYRPLPPPPRPPRENKKKYIGQNKCEEVDVSIQTDPLPDDFICEDFEITDDMKIIEPSRNSRTLDDVLQDDEEMRNQKWYIDENLTKGIQKFREANQKSFSEKSKGSSQADRSKSLSRPQTPAILIERRVPTPVPNTNETMLEASLTVQPLNDIDFEDDIQEDYIPEHSSYEGSTSIQPSTIKSVASDEEIERLREFEAEEQKLKDLEQQRLREEEEELAIMEKIRQFRDQERLEQEEIERQERELEDQKILDKILELERQEEEERKIMEKVLELQRQEDENRKIMDKIRQLEEEFNNSAVTENVDQEITKTLKDQLSSERRIPSAVDEIVTTELLEEIEASPPPNPPPRKRSTVANVPQEEENLPTVESFLSPQTEVPVIIPTPLQAATVLPNRMTLADLEVERLRVHALQAGHIMVSSLQGCQVAADELQCKSGNLVVRNIELPPGFIEEIVDRVRSTERSHVQQETQTTESGEQKTSTEPPSVPPRRQNILEEPPSRPPLPQQQTPQPPLFPSEYMHSLPPSAFYQLRNPIAFDDPEDYQPNLQAPRRRRHHRKRDSSSEDSYRRGHTSRSSEQSVAHLGSQFLQACGSAIVRQMNHAANYIRSREKSSGDRSIGTLIAIFILMTLGFLLMALSGKDIHHHHWDFFNPPGSDGRPQL